MPNGEQEPRMEVAEMRDLMVQLQEKNSPGAHGGLFSSWPRKIRCEPRNS